MKKLKRLLLMMTLGTCLCATSSVSPQSALASRDAVWSEPIGVIDEGALREPAPQSLGTHDQRLPHESPQVEAFCQAVDSLPKSLLFGSFVLAEPEQARLGQLYGIDRALPRLLAARGHGQTYQGRFEPLDRVDLHRVWSNRELTVTDWLKLTAIGSSQYLVLGGVESLAMRNAEEFVGMSTWTRSSWQAQRRVRGWVGLEPEHGAGERVFAVRLRVFDLSSGRRIMDELFSTVGRWEFARFEAVGFASHKFWRSEYGAAAEELIAAMVSAMGTRLACEPYTVPLNVAEDQSAWFGMDAERPVQVGDKLDVLRQDYVLPPHAGYAATVSGGRIALHPTSATATVTQVLESHVVTELSEPLRRGNRYVTRLP